MRVPNNDLQNTPLEDENYRMKSLDTANKNSPFKI